MTPARRLALVALLAGCGGNAGGTPLTVTVVPASSVAPSASLPPAAPAGSDARTGTELVVAHGRWCYRTDGRVYCAPMSATDEPLVQDRNRVTGLDDATSVAMGQAFACATTRPGGVVCWGDNAFGQLGAHLRADSSDAPVPVVGVAKARRVFAGPWHACAVGDDGGVRCWGRNENGQTGSDTSYSQAARELVGASEVPGVVADRVTCTFSATCARAAAPAHTVTCWGALRDDPSGANTRPKAMTRLGALDDLAGGEAAFCGLRDGRVVCWGEGRRLVAHAPPGSSTDLAEVSGIANAKSLALADDHGCALLADGRVACFGLPYSQALGRPLAEPQNGSWEPVPGQVVDDLPRAVAVTVTSGVSCALGREGDAFCWGRWYSVLGTHDVPKPTPMKLR